MKNLLLEAIAVAAAGGALAFAANALSPSGLQLSRNYFPGAAPIHAAAAHGMDTNGPSPVEELRARLAAEGLQFAGSNQINQFFRDPRYKEDLIVFLDARDDEHYQEGHIPGAYQFDHYHPEKYLADILPLCQAAQQIVVYCNGGDCEDSEHAAVMLRDAGVPKEKLFVYGGGITEWASSGQAEESGSRNSGRFVRQDNTKGE